MVKVAVNKTQLNHIFACLATLKVLVNSLGKSIPEDSAREFAIQLQQNVLTQENMGGYAPLKPWKKDEPNANRFWDWYSDAVKSIKAQQVNISTWYAGFGFAGATAGVGRGGGRKAKVAKAKASNVKTSIRKAEKQQKKGVILRKPGQTTQKVLDDRKALIAQRVARSKRESHSEHTTVSKGPTVRIYTKEEIAKRQAEIDHESRVKEGSGRSISFGHEKRIKRGTQHN